MTEIKLREPVANNIGPAKGLYHAGVTRFPGAVHQSEIPMMENRKFITGLDKYDPSVTSISDPTLRNKKIEELTKLRESLESRLGYSLDQDTQEGREFFESKIIDFNEIERLSPQDPEDKLLLTIIYANMFAKEFPVAKDKDQFGGDVLNTKEYYIANVEEELGTTVTKKLKKAKCVEYLSAMYETDPIKLNKVACCVLPATISITDITSKDYIYTKLDEYIDGQLSLKDNTSIDKALNTFLEVFLLDKKELDLRTTLTKAVKYNIIAKNSQNKWNNRASGTILGIELAEVYDYYRNPENQEEYGLDKKTDQVYSLKYQIKQKELI